MGMLINVAKWLKRPIRIAIELIELPLIIVVAAASRYFSRRIDVGLGPLPMINNVYHKDALELFGYSAETFVDSVYFITNKFDKIFAPKTWLGRRLAREFHVIFFFAIFRYRSLYIYFTGGPLYATVLLWRIEPFLYKIAGIRTVVMPFGGDVQALNRSPNLLYRHVMSRDYPLQRHSRRAIEARIDIWTDQADHVISGCDWVDYMHFWHTLMIAHFSIDLELWSARTHLVQEYRPGGRPLRVLHAPNHRAIKGSEYFIRAVEELRAEGVEIELVLVERQSNEKIRELMASVDVVADQLIIGWYAMFAIEAMAMGKLVLCHLRHDLISLYENAGLLKADEIPIANCSPASVKETLRRLTMDPAALQDAAARGPEYVRRHHSFELVGAVFDGINRSIGVSSSARARRQAAAAATVKG